MTATAVALEKAMVGQPAPDFDMASTKNLEKLNENVKLADYIRTLACSAFLSARLYVCLSYGTDGVQRSL